MKAASPIAPNPVSDSKSVAPSLPHPVRLNGSTYQHLNAPKPKSCVERAEIKLPELTAFRALTKDVFGVEAGREFIKEAIVFGFMMAVAAWPLSITLDMLGTMMVSPPAW